LPNCSFDCSTVQTCKWNSCISGYYPYGASSYMPEGCKKCPNYSTDWTSNGGTVKSEYSHNNGYYIGIASCYVSGNFSDTTGNFTISGTSCTYSSN
jgi:hypothetical protein